MGKITNMQDNQDNVNLSYIRNKIRPPFEKKGIKGFVTLLGPNAKKYRLSSEQRNKQLKGRLTIAGIATLLAISGGIAAGNSIHNNVAETQEFLQEEELMEAAENKLLDCVFGTNRENINNPEVSYSFDNHDGSTILRITSGEGDSKKVLYTYSKNLSLDKVLNAKEISSLMDNAIDIHFAEEVSQKQLQNLNDSLENLEDKEFKLDGKYIIEDKQIEYDDER